MDVDPIWDHIEQLRQQLAPYARGHVWPRARDGQVQCVACGLVITEDNMRDVMLPCEP